jgi:hypothetical protein
MTKLIVPFSVLALLLAQSGCQKLPDQTLSSDSLTEAIPIEYGEVVGVTPHGAHPYQAVVWLEKADKTIVAIRVDLARNAVVADPLLTIPRR